MSHDRLASSRRLAAVLIVSLAPTSAWAQQPAGTAPEDPIEAINATFNHRLRELERERLDRLAELAARSEGPMAIRAYETYLRDALNAGLFAEAEPTAQRLLEGQAPTAVVRYLAEVVNILAEADRGDFEASLQSIVNAAHASDEEPEAGADLARRSLPPSARLSLLDTYYQRLVQSGQYEIARKAFEAIRQNAQEGDEPDVQEYLDHRIQQLAMIGRPAPSFQGTDVDGRPVRLEEFAGRPVLLVFWATWYRPNAEQVAWMKQSFATYRDQGLQVLGVNLDALVGEGRPVEEVLPEVRRYVLEYNITWPNVVNPPGEGDISSAYGVTEIPANVLIDREGRIAALDLNAASFDREVEKVLGDPASGSR